MRHARIFSIATPAFAALMLAPAVANAATVAVADEGTNHTLTFAAEPSETNTVSLDYEVEPPSSPTVAPSLTYFLTDATAPLVAGPGCSGGGDPGSTVTCQLAYPVMSCFIRGCPPLPPPASSRLVIDVGDFDDSIDTRKLSGSPVSFQLIGGPGADLLEDADASASFVPGTGPDHVITGIGFDYVEASTGAPDEPDIYEFGSYPDGTLRYSDATYPISVSLDGAANDGADGEGDQVLGTPAVEGGPESDVLIGNEVFNDLAGFDGDDLIIGGGGDDSLTGGRGDDRLRGSAGDDVHRGDSGDDAIRGGSGNDLVQGDSGRDNLLGGSGYDQLLGANAAAPDKDRDKVDCGSGADGRAWVGPEDLVRHCERIKPQG